MKVLRGIMCVLKYLFIYNSNNDRMILNNKLNNDKISDYGISLYDYSGKILFIASIIYAAERNSCGINVVAIIGISAGIYLLKEAEKMKIIKYFQDIKSEV